MIGFLRFLQNIIDRKRAKVANDEEQRQLTEIIQSSPVPTFVIDAQHRVTHWNRACEIVMGVPASEMVGTTNQWRAFYPEPRPVMADLILDLANDSTIERYYPGRYRSSAFIENAMESEDFFPHFPNGGRWLHFTAAPLHGPDGNVVGAIEILQDITERKRAEAAIAENERRLSEEKYRTLFTEMINAFALHEIILDESGQPCDYRFLSVNPAFERMTGLVGTDIIGRRVLEVFPNLERSWINRYGRVTLTGEPAAFEDYSRDLDKHFEVRSFRPAPGQFAVIFQDITSRRRVEARLKLLASVFEHTQEGIVVTDPDGTILEVNDAFTRITGYDREELVDQTPRLLRSGRHGPEFYRSMWATLSEQGLWRGEVWNRRKNGEIYPEQLTISAVLDDRGQAAHYVGVISDITASKRHAAELERIAHYDALTGLPNRMLLQDRMQQAIAKAQRDDKLLAVCFLDVDGFKPINDTYGHGMGDHLLMELADRFRCELRGGDTAARLGGDEFVILLADLADEADCRHILQRILDAVKRPFTIDGNCVTVSASIGVTLFPIHGTDCDTLLRQADQAMYSAKQRGKNAFFFYDTDQDVAAREQRKTVIQIEQALSNQEFVLHYQPKVDMRRGLVVGAEALIRWHRPGHRILLPGEFLPLIEDTDVMVAIGDWVIAQTLRQLAIWHNEGLQLSVSVNIAARHLQRADFVQRLEAHLKNHGQAPHGCLEIEVTETAVIKEMNRLNHLIDACRELGVTSVLDDFGTGYSSLTYLKLLPVQTLKIDRSFIRDMLLDPEDLAIVEGVIGLAKAFGRAVIAEGVESVEHGTLLLHLGCDLAQGFGIARPMPPDQFLTWTRTWQPDPAWLAVGRKGWTHEDIPLIIAPKLLCSWVADVLALLDNSREAKHPLALSPLMCRLGLWYDGPGRKYQAYPEYRTIGSLHVALHQIGEDILRLREEGDLDQARERSTDLLLHRDRLLELFNELVNAVAGPGGGDDAGPRL